MKEMKPTQANVETTNAVVELGLATLFAEIFSKCFYVDWSGPDGRSIAFSNMCRVALSMCNATDKSPVLCRQVVDDGLHTNILKYLNDPKLDPARAKNTGIKNCVFSMMCILYNALKVGYIRFPRHLCRFISCSVAYSSRFQDGNVGYKFKHKSWFIS